MLTRMKAWWRDTRGISLPLALVVLALGTLLVGPLLWCVGTGISAIRAVETNLYRQYTSDAGAKYVLFALDSGSGIHFSDGHTYFHGLVTAGSLGSIGTHNDSDPSDAIPITTGATESPLRWDIAMFDDVLGNHDDESWVQPPKTSAFTTCTRTNRNINDEVPIEPGLHYVEGDINFNGGNQTVDGITIVATGRVNFDGGHRSFTPYVDGLDIMKASTSSQAVSFNGGHAAGGAIHAPNGGIMFNSGHNLSGAFVASRITLNGEHNHIDVAPVRVRDGPGGVYDIRTMADGSSTHIRASELTVLAWQLSGNGNG